MNSTPLSLLHCIQQKQSARVGSDVSCDLGVLEELLNATCVQMLCGCGEVLKTPGNVVTVKEPSALCAAVIWHKLNVNCL